MMSILGTFFSLYIVSAYKVSADENYIDDKDLTIAGSIGAICNGSSRLVWATLVDKYRFKTVYAFIMSAQLVIASTFYFTREHPGFYIVWVCCSYMFVGGHFSCYPLMIAKIFGLTNGGQITSIAFLMLPVSSLSSFALVFFESKPTMIYIVGAALTLLNLVILYNFDDSPMKRE